MGQCVSAPPLPPASGEPTKEGIPANVPVLANEPSSRVTADAVQLTDFTPPVRVLRDGKECGVVLRPTRSGRLEFGVTDQPVDPTQVAHLIQRHVQANEARKQLENFKLLQSMGLEVRYSSSNPFIGKLTLKVLEVAGIKNPSSTYVKVHCEGDRSKKAYAVGPGDAPDRARFDHSGFIFIVLHSDATVLVKLRDTKAAKLYGQVTVPIHLFNQGTEVREFVLHAPGNEAQQIATARVEVTYQWLRGTEDEGSYLGPSRVVINKRRIRGMGLASSIHYISQVNHYLLSHDNIFNPSPDYKPPVAAKAEQASTDSDSPPTSPTASVSKQSSEKAFTLATQSGNTGASAADRWKRSVARVRRGDREAGEQESAVTVMSESTLLDALGPQEADTPEVAALKQQLLALMVTVSERLDAVEAVQEQQTAAIANLTASSSKPGDIARASVTVSEPTQAFLSGTFEYGMGRAAAKRKVYLFINKAQDQRALTPASVSFLGVYKTDATGRIRSVPVPPAVWRTPGHYNVVGLLPEDNSFAKGSLFILAPGSKAVVFDMDGTLTVGDSQVVTMFALDALAGSTAAAQNITHKYDLKQFKHALTTVRAWAAKGYQPVYISGRQGSYYNLTLEWLIKHGYPPGPIHLTRTHLPTLPIYYSVGNFKVEYMEKQLKAKGIDIYAAYGNTPTDIRAYAAVGIPKERTFIVGPHGGKAGTVKVDNYTDHLAHIFSHPDADVPIPYTELLFTANPGYKRRVRVKGPDGIEHTVSTISNNPDGEEEDAEEDAQESASLPGHQDPETINEDGEAENEVQDAQASLTTTEQPASGPHANGGV